MNTLNTANMMVASHKIADETRTDERIDKVAAAFIAVLRQWLSEDTREKTKSITFDAAFVANANDYFDANMAMDEAFTKCGLHAIHPETGIMSDEMSDLFNNAWNRAILMVQEGN
jgi:hypothetical protein